MTDVPVIIKLPFACPNCGEEVSGEVGPLLTNRQALCGFCGRTIDLVGENMIAVQSPRSDFARGDGQR
jgi:hypothetical protein